MGLDELRQEIRGKDEEILRAIAERTRIAEEIGREKASRGLPLRDEAVEKGVLDRYASIGSSLGLEDEVCRSVASAVIRQAVDSEAALQSPSTGKRAAVVGGAGKMGAWLAGILSRSGYEVSIVDPACPDGKDVSVCSECDLVAVSVPIRSADRVMAQIESLCSPDALVFDITSLKTPLEARLRRMARRMRACSVHPMFGPSATSMHGRNLIVCDCGNREAAEAAASLFEGMGGSVRVMDLSRHDSYMSYVLGLTHAVNIALFTVLERSGYAFEDLMTVASTTFRKGLDTNMSVASEDPLLYYEIQHMNSHREEMWKLFSEAVEDLRERSLSDDPSGFVELMEAGRSYFGGASLRNGFHQHH